MRSRGAPRPHAPHHGAVKYEVKLPGIVQGERRGQEAVPAGPLGARRFRVRGSPGLVEGLAAGDGLELDAAAPLGYRLLRRGGNLSVWFYCARDVRENDAEQADLRGAVEALAWSL